MIFHEEDELNYRIKPSNSIIEIVIDYGKYKK